MKMDGRCASFNIPVINCLRGIAASMVCLFHFVTTTTGYIETEAIKDFFWFGKTGVHMFFVISGIVIPLSMIRANYSFNNWRQFMLKRIARLEPPYLASLILAILYFKVRLLSSSSSTVDIMPGFRDLMLHIGYLVPFLNGKWAIDVYWTLSVEFQYYIVLSLLLPLVLSGKVVIRYCFYALFLILPFFLNGHGFFPVYAPLFLMGIVYVFMLTGNATPYECMIIVSLCLVAGFGVLNPSYTVAGFITLLIIHFIPLYTNRMLRFLGEISYSLYLVHIITGGAMINFLSHKFKAPYQKPIVIIGGYLVAIACSYVFYLIFEKPSQRLSSRIKYYNPPGDTEPLAEMAKK